MDLIYIIVIAVLILTLVFLLVKIRKLNIDKNIVENSKNQFRKVLNSIQQSILLFNNEDKLMFYNKHAYDTLSIDYNHMNLTAQMIFKNSKIDDVFYKRERHRVFDVNFEGKIYLVHIYSINTNDVFNNNVQTIVILNNVTEARKIDQTKKDFFAHASHELKSPLTAILGYSELVSLQMVEPDEYDDIIQRIYNQALHMSLLVEDMSILSRLESITDDQKDRRNILLEEVLKETLYTLEPFIEEKNIEINIDMDKNIEYLCIPLDLNKLFKNLIENAIKYSNIGSQVKIKLKKNKDNKVIFEVKDQGIGIAKDQIGRIFERFYRIDKGRLEPGTGLGLAIVKHTVLKYQGEVLVDSNPGVGTTITIKLPATN